jgi:hypothetical protein
MNPTKFEWMKTELKRRFYELNKISGKLVNIRKRISIQSDAFTFSEREGEFLEIRFGLRVLYLKMSGAL